MTKLYKYKDGCYEIVQRSKLKNPKTGEWVPCVIYKSVANGETFVRVAWDFDQKFKEEM